MRIDSERDPAKVTARLGAPSRRFCVGGLGPQGLPPWGLVGVALALLTSSCATPLGRAAKDNRCAFMEITNFSSFTNSAGVSNHETVLLSPIIAAPIEWNELVLSWNVPSGVYLKAEARVYYPHHVTHYYTLGSWSDEPQRFPRESTRRQKDEDGAVRVDTLILSNTTRWVQLRITVGSADGPRALKLLGLSFCNSTVPVTPQKPNHAAWGKVLEVPERRQAEYEGGGGWCSPTSLSMVLAYWSERLQRPELNHSVPETAHAIADSSRGDTGNWPFNTAYAGHYPGMKAYVTRLGDIAELEDWIAAGIPVVISVSSYLTNDRTSGPDNGHLIVCVGFTDTGDVVTNDPGVSVRRNVRARRVYAREKVIHAWDKSKHAVYLIYPDSAKPPGNRLGHWAG
jgi:hypothetical protein